MDSLVQTFHQSLIVTMRGHVGGNATSYGVTKQIEISDQIQYLVAYEFVGITKFRIDDFAVVHDDMGIEVSTTNLSKSLGYFDIFKGIE